MALSMEEERIPTEIASQLSEDDPVQMPPTPLPISWAGHETSGRLPYPSTRAGPSRLYVTT